LIVHGVQQMQQSDCELVNNKACTQRNAEKASHENDDKSKQHARESSDARDVPFFPALPSRSLMSLDSSKMSGASCLRLLESIRKGASNSADG
jgi:hypothetical protein